MREIAYCPSLGASNKLRRMRTEQPEPTPYVEQGARIQQRRIELGLKQVQLAHRIGTDGGTISRWERGVASPRDLTKLAQALRVSIDWIKTGVTGAAPEKPRESEVADAFQILSEMEPLSPEESEFLRQQVAEGIFSSDGTPGVVRALRMILVGYRGRARESDPGPDESPDALSRAKKRGGRRIPPKR